MKQLWGGQPQQPASEPSAPRRERQQADRMRLNTLQTDIEKSLDQNGTARALGQPQAQSWWDRLMANGVGFLTGGMGASTSTQRRGGLHQSGSKRVRRHVTWSTVLVSSKLDVGGQKEDGDGLLARDWRELAATNARTFASLIQLPHTTYEFVMAPLRVAFADEMLIAAIPTDALMDVLALLDVAKTLHDGPPAGAAKAATRPWARFNQRLLLALNCAGIAMLWIARPLFSTTPVLWHVAQGVRFVRYLDMHGHIVRYEDDIRTRYTLVGLYKYIILTVGHAHLFACLWWAIAQVQRWYDGVGEFPADSWVMQNLRFSGNPRFNMEANRASEKYALSLYMAFAGLTTSGYGAITIRTVPELVLCAVVCQYQIIFYARVLGTMFHFLFRTDETVKAFKSLLRVVNAYVSARQLPFTLHRRLTAHFEFQHKKTTLRSKHVYTQMPELLRTKTAHAINAAHIFNCRIFTGCNEQFLRKVVVSLTERYLMPLEVLFRQHDASRELYFCTDGSMHVRKDARFVRTIRGDANQGTIVGEAAFILGVHQPYSVGAVGTGDVSLLVLSKRQFESYIASYPEQLDVVTSNLLKQFDVDKQGKSLTNHNKQLEEDEAIEYEELKAIVSAAMVRRNEATLAQITYAASEGDIDTVKLLAAHGLDINAGDYDARSTLHLAASEGNVKVVQLLLELDADPNAKDRWGGTPLRDAVNGKHEALCTILREAGATMTLDDPAGALCDAASQGQLDYLATLLANGIDINSYDYDRRSALHLAASEGKTRVVEFLIQNLADVNFLDRFNQSAIDDAIQHRESATASVLRDNGGKPNKDKAVARLLLAIEEGDLEMLGMLTKAGMDINQPNYDSRTALHHAAAHGQLTVVDFLTYHQAEVNVVDRWLNTPVVDAITHGYADVALLLYSLGGRPYIASPDPRSSINMAMERMAGEEVIHIMRKINVIKSEGKASAKQLASKQRNLKVLLEKFAGNLSKYEAVLKPLTSALLLAVPRWAAMLGAANDGSVASSQDLGSLAGSEDSEFEWSDEEDEVAELAAGVASAPVADADGAAAGAPAPRRPSQFGEGENSDMEKKALAMDPEEAKRKSKDLFKALMRVLLQTPKINDGLEAMRLVYHERLKECEARLNEEGVALVDQTKRVHNDAIMLFLKTDMRLSPQFSKVVSQEVLASPAFDANGLVPGLHKHVFLSLFFSPSLVSTLSTLNGKTPSELEFSAQRLVRRSSVLSDTVAKAGALVARRGSRRSSAEFGSRRRSADSRMSGADSSEREAFDAHRRASRMTGGAEVETHSAALAKAAAAYNAKAAAASGCGSWLSSALFGNRASRRSSTEVARRESAQLSRTGSVQAAPPSRAPGVRRTSLETFFKTVGGMAKRRSHEADVGGGGGQRSANVGRSLPDAGGGSRSVAGGAALELSPNRPSHGSRLSGQDAAGLPDRVAAVQLQADTETLAYDIGEAAYLIACVFHTFNLDQRGVVSVKKIKTSLRAADATGEVGRSEIGPLLKKLSVSVTDGPKGILDEANFFVSFSLWVQGSLSVEKDEFILPPIRFASDVLDSEALSQYEERALWDRRLAASKARTLEEEGGDDGEAGNQHGNLASLAVALNMQLVASGTPLDDAAQDGAPASAGEDVAGAEARPNEAEEAIAAAAREKEQATLVNRLRIDHMLHQIRRKKAALDAAGQRYAPVDVSDAILLLEDAADDTTMIKKQEFITWSEEVIGIKWTGGEEVTWFELEIALADRRKAADGTSGLFSFFDRLWHGTNDAEVAWYIFDPKSPTLLYLRCVFAAVAIYYFFFVPIRISFHPHVRDMAWVAALDYTCDALCYVQICATFFMPYVNKKGVMTSSLEKIRRHYLANRFGWDVAATFPLDLLTIAVLSSDDAAVLVPWLRVPRLLHLLNFTTLLSAWSSKFEEANTKIVLVRHFVTLVIFLHYNACAWNMVGFDSAVDNSLKHRWPDDFYNVQFRGFTSVTASHLPDDWSLGHQWLVCAFWSTCMLVSQGHNIVYGNFAEIGFALFLCTLNLTVYAIIVGQISTMVMKRDEDNLAKRLHLEAVQGYVTSLSLPDELVHEIKHHFTAKVSGLSHDVDDDGLLSSLPLPLKVDVKRTICKATVAKTLALDGCDEAFIDAFCVQLKEGFYEAGESVYRTNEVSQKIYVVKSGVVEVFVVLASSDEDGKDEEVLQFKAINGDAVGEIAFVFNMRHSNNARASLSGSAVNFELTREDFRDLLKYFPEQDEVLMRNIVREWDADGPGGDNKSVRSKSSRTSRGTKKTANSKGGDSVAPSVSAKGSRMSASDKRSSRSRGASTVVDKNAIDNDAKIYKHIQDAKSKREDEYTVRLCEACARGDMAAVTRLIVDYEINVNRGDYDQRTPLHLAACEGKMEVMELLIKEGADVHARDRYHGTPLTDAIREKHIKCAELLRAQGASLVNEQMASKVCAAGANGDLPALMKLLENGADILAHDYDGRTALHLACAEGHITLVQKLLEFKADIHALDRFGQTPLQDAYRHEQVEISELLLKRGAKLGVLDAADKYCIAAAKGNADRLSSLIYHGCDVNAYDQYGRTALHLGSSNGNVLICHMLMEPARKVNLNQIDHWGNTPLDDAIRHGHRVIQLLLEQHGAKRAADVPSGKPYAIVARRSLVTTESEEYATQTELERDIKQAVEELNESRRIATKVRKLLMEVIVRERRREALANVPATFWEELRTFIVDSVAAQRWLGSLKELRAKVLKLRAVTRSHSLEALMHTPDVQNCLLNMDKIVSLAVNHLRIKAPGELRSDGGAPGDGASVAGMADATSSEDEMDDPPQRAESARAAGAAAAAPSAASAGDLQAREPAAASAGADVAERGEPVARPSYAPERRAQGPEV